MARKKGAHFFTSVRKKKKKFYKNIKQVYTYLTSHYRTPGFRLCVIVVFLFLGTGWLLFFEYRFFCVQSEKVVEIKEEYRTYILAVKKMLGEYAKAKERIDELEAMLEKGKKNGGDVLEFVSSPTTFGEGARVYATDDTDDEQEFMMINREPGYLKQESLDFFKKQNLAYLTQYVDTDFWLDYMQQLQEQEHNNDDKPKKDRNRTEVKRVSISRKLLANGYRDRPSIYDMLFTWPVGRSNFWLSSLFGSRKKPDGSNGFHHGIDMAAVKGTPIMAAASGIVVEAQRVSAYGNTIVVAHNRKYRTRYAHLDDITVKVGQKVKRGELIGRVGDTGFVRKSGKDASHLHFEVYAFGKRVNPIYYLIG